MVDHAGFGPAISCKYHLAASPCSDRLGWTDGDLNRISRKYHSSRRLHARKALGGPCRIRTGHLLRARETLYQMS